MGFAIIGMANLLSFSLEALLLYPNPTQTLTLTTNHPDH